VSEEDVKATLVATRIAELEAKLERFAAMRANLQNEPDISGYRYATEQIDLTVAELESLKSPAKEPEPQSDGPSLHAVLLVIGLIVGVYGLAQHAWTALGDRRGPGRRVAAREDQGLRRQHRRLTARTP
jgi:hypothetical protein